MGIRGQLALLVPGVVALTLVGAAFAVAEQQRASELEEMRLRSERVLEAVGVTAAVFVAENDMASLDTLIDHISSGSRYPDLEEMAVLDGDGFVVAHSTPERFNTRLDDAFTARSLAAAGPVWAREGRSLRVGVPAISGLRWATVTARFSLERLEAEVAVVRRRMILGGVALAGLLMMILFVGLDRLVVRPLRLLQRITRRMGEGDLDARVPPLRGQELSELSDTVNRMAGTLKTERENLERAVSERTRELRDANSRLEKLAVTDGLTGVFNHRRFQEALSAEVLRSARTDRPLSVLMVDVDHFKRYNDSMGHPAGDELLRKLAQVLQGELRATDVLARYGGEEFAAVLPETNKELAMQVGERLRSSVETELNRGSGYRHRVSISVGLATYKDDGDGPQALIAAADRALYAAKNKGRNQVVAAGATVSR